MTTKAYALLVPLALAVGCGGHFDKFESGTNASEQRSPTRALFPQTHFVGQSLPGFTFARDGRFVSTFDMTDNVVVVAVADRGATSELVPWIDDISARYGERLELIPIINLHNENWMSKYVFRAFTTGRAYWQYFGSFRERRTYLPQPVLDYSGRIEEALALSGHGPFIVVARNGRIAGFFAGRAVEDRLLSLRTMLDEFLPVEQNQPLAAVSTPVVLGEKPMLTYSERPRSEAPTLSAPEQEAENDAEPLDDFALLPGLGPKPTENPASSASEPDEIPEQPTGKAPVVTAFIPDAVAVIEEPVHRPAKQPAVEEAPLPSFNEPDEPAPEKIIEEPRTPSRPARVDEDIQDILRELEEM